MGIFLTLLLFLVGFWALLKGADLLVRGATSVAQIFGISPWVIGVLVVGIGTSIPELTINIVSAWRGAEIGLGTIVGSNTFNTLFILGLSSLLVPIAMEPAWIKRDLVINTASILLAGALAFLPLTREIAGPVIGHREGLILLAAFIVWVVFMLRRRQIAVEPISGTSSLIVASWLAVLMMVIGFFGVFLGGRWVVSGATTIAELLGIGQTFIAVVIVGVGTSIPELVVSITALWQKKNSLAIGNIIGSNIFDFLGILGISSLFGNIRVSNELAIDMTVTLVATIMLLAAMFLGRRYVLERREGALMIATYLIYLFFVFTRAII